MGSFADNIEYRIVQALYYFCFYYEKQKYLKTKEERFQITNIFASHLKESDIPIKETKHVLTLVNDAKQN